MTAVYFDICDLFNYSSFFNALWLLKPWITWSIRFKCAINLVLLRHKLDEWSSRIIMCHMFSCLNCPLPEFQLLLHMWILCINFLNLCKVVWYRIKAHCVLSVSSDELAVTWSSHRQVWHFMLLWIGSCIHSLCT